GVEVAGAGGGVRGEMVLGVPGEGLAAGATGTGVGGRSGRAAGGVAGRVVAVGQGRGAGRSAGEGVRLGRSRGRVGVVGRGVAAGGVDGLGLAVAEVVERPGLPVRCRAAERGSRFRGCAVATRWSPGFGESLREVVAVALAVRGAAGGRVGD